MAKRIIECQVNDEYVLGSGVVVGAAGSHDDVVLRLAFGEMWVGRNIYATFNDANGENPVLSMLMASMLVPGETMTYDVTIPPEAKRYAGKMMLTLTGYSIVDGVQEDMATNTTTAYFRVLPSDFAHLDDGTVTPTLAQQVQDEMRELYSVFEEHYSKIEGVATAENDRKTAEVKRAEAEFARSEAEVKRETAAKEATERANAISKTLEEKLENGDFKGEKGEKGEKGDDGEQGYNPVRGVDYWTPEEQKLIERIVMDKSSMIGGFIPVVAPVMPEKSDYRPNNTLAKITNIKVENDKCIVTFNENEELLTDGSLESYDAGTSLVLLNNDGKSEYGWSGINFDGASTRYARIESSATSHSGGKVLRVRSPYSSIWKSLKLKPNTDYTFSFWCKGKAGDHFSNITIAGRATEGNIHYANIGGAFLCDKNATDYRILKDIWYHVGDAGEYLETADAWQKFSLNFSTCDEEYVDICIYFGTSYGDFYFDDFSIKEVLGEVFTASYDIDKVQGYDWLKVGSYFLVDCHSTHFSRFEYASSLAIVKLYRHISDSAKTAYQYAVEAGFEGTEENYKSLLLMKYAPLDHTHDYAPLDHAHDYAKIESGSYVGTGACDQANANELTFNFVPKAVILDVDNSTGRYHPNWEQDLIILIYGQTKQNYFGQISHDDDGDPNWSYGDIRMEWSGKTVRWWSRNEELQFNKSGVPYSYIAIG